MNRLTHRYLHGGYWASIFKVSACGENECRGEIIDKLAEYENAEEQTLQEKAERDKMRCENCKHIRSNNNFHWCGCTAGLDGNRKLTDFCSYFEPKESEGK